MNWRNFLFGLLCSILILSSVPAYGQEGVSEKKPQNKYTEQYFQEKKEKKNESNSEENNNLVDPQVEEQIILETLSYYYEEDLKVASALVQFYNDSDLYEKTMSLIKEDKVEVMHKIMDIYSSVKDPSDQEVLRDYIERYARSSGDKKAINFLDKNTTQSESESVNIQAVYGTAAGDWAYNNYNKYSLDYPKFSVWGSDCANFVSQAIHVGGSNAMEGTWYIIKKNSVYWEPENADQLNYSWDLSDPSPWISVSQFRKYWVPKSTVHSMSHDYYVENHKSVYGRSIYKGDVVVFHKGVAGWVTIPTHLMIISAYDTVDKDFKLAGHSNERQALPLLTAIYDYSYIEILEIPYDL